MKSKRTASMNQTVKDDLKKYIFLLADLTIERWASFMVSDGLG